MSASAAALENVSKVFSVAGREVEALADVSFDVREGECLAVVGESGSGKTTVANILLGVFPPTSGRMFLFGEELPQRRRLEHRRAIQLVQQNPLSSLNPKRTVGASIRLALDVHGIGERRQRASAVAALLEEVGLEAALARRYPAALSGGQRQRVAIARALACGSRVLVLDEPTSALDVLVQARVLKLLSDIRSRRNLAFVFITHDLSVVRNVADRVAVFENGRVVETAQTEALFAGPRHPYTRNLVGAVPVVTKEEEALRSAISKGADQHASD